jgi:hypothetical protein
LSPVAASACPETARTGLNQVYPAGTAPRVSVVIPTLNEVRNLPHVFALLPQDIYEVVLVDGTSTDAVARATRWRAASRPAGATSS